MSRKIINSTIKSDQNFIPNDLQNVLLKGPLHQAVVILQDQITPADKTDVRKLQVQKHNLITFPMNYNEIYKKRY